MGGYVLACHYSLTILVQLIFIIPALNAFPQYKTGEEAATARSNDCCNQIEVSVASNSGLYIANYPGIYTRFENEGSTEEIRVAWISTSFEYAIWFMPDYGWVIGNKSFIDYINQPEVRSLEVPLPPQTSGRSENIAECPERNFNWYWFNNYDNKWEYGGKK